MPRLMSFALTTEQIELQTKTVTRRQGWQNLKPGTLLQPVKKAMGLRRGEKVQRLGCLIEVVSVRWEPLNRITIDDVRAEGFPDWSRSEFVEFYQKANKLPQPWAPCNRIAFRYTEPVQ